MKEKILKSNKYQHYKMNLFVLTSVYFLLFVIFNAYLLIGIDTIDNPASIFLMINLVVLVPFLPVILYFCYKTVSIKKNINNYKVYQGVIKNIYSGNFSRIQSRDLSVKVEERLELLETKVFSGPLFDEVAKNVKVEILYDEKRQDAIITKVLE
ncbi:hypothetical protein [Acholeplasma hippikon]|uniref:hypothetical protein n=1 Tax=Acholeplasma hippikon TaxID=264636 RepID=UPI00054E8617|nr:hypothetical protein [Acholeplasma hippikon]